MYNLPLSTLPLFERFTLFEFFSQDMPVSIPLFPTINTDSLTSFSFQFLSLIAPAGAKTRGGTVEVPRIRGENFTVAEKISIFQEQGETSLRVEETLEGVWDWSLPRDSEVEREELYLNLKKNHINVHPI